MYLPDQFLSICRTHTMLILIMRLDLSTLNTSKSTELAGIRFTISVSPHMPS